MRTTSTTHTQLLVNLERVLGNGAVCSLGLFRLFDGWKFGDKKGQARSTKVAHGNLKLQNNDENVRSQGSENGDEQ